MSLRFVSLLGAGLLCFSVAACGSGSDAPKVAAPYQKYMDEAWSAAGSGEDPVKKCAAVVGYASGVIVKSPEKVSDAAVAYRACYVDVRVLYTETLLADSQSKDIKKSCNKLGSSIRIQRMAFGSLAAKLGLEQLALDNEIKNRVQEKIKAACPDYVDEIMWK